MNALTNAKNQPGGNKASCAGLTSSVTSKIQSINTENSQTGVSSNYVQKENHKWFVFRATYNQVKQALKDFENAQIQTYIPRHYVIKVINGKKTRILEPYLPNLIFAYATRDDAEKLVRHPAPSSYYLKYYLDKTKEREVETSKHPPMQISFDDMINFINVTSLDNEHIITVSPDHCHYKSGDKVRIIYGEFKGIEGYIARVLGQSRVVVEIKGLCVIATAYIPKNFICSLDKTDI